MGSRIWAALVAGGLLVGAGVMTSVISAPQTAAAHEGPERDSDRGVAPRIMGLLGEVLDDLVSQGTIERVQAEAILDAAEAKARELEEEREALHEQIRGFLEDGVITEGEASQLPDDHFLLSDRYDEAWEDGELSRDEIGPHSHRGFFKRGFRLGSLLDDGGIDQGEYDALSDDHPLKQVDVSEYLEDGLMTSEELREVFEQIKSSGEDA